MLGCEESNFSNFLRENEFLRKTILACLSGDQMGLKMKKNRGQKSRDTAPLTCPTYTNHELLDRKSSYELFNYKVNPPKLQMNKSVCNHSSNKQKHKIRKITNI